MEFLEAWSVSDVFADGELLIAAFKRGKDRYAFTATVANNAQGTVVEVLLVDPVDLPDILAEIRAEFSEGPDGVFSLDRLEAGELRRRLEPAVRETLVDEDEYEEEDVEDADDEDEDDSEDDGDSLNRLAEELEEDPGFEAGEVDEAFAELDARAAREHGADGAEPAEGHPDFDEYGDEEDEDEGDDFAALRALMLSRLAVLPEPAELPGGADFGYDLDDLAPLLDEFAASDDARGLPHPAIVREWGEVFARLGLTEFAGDPPLYGPEKFDTLINVLIPARVNADDAQLELLEPAATAWARWSTRRVGLAEPIGDYLVEAVGESFEDFPQSYADPVFTMDRHMFGFTMQSSAG